MTLTDAEADQQVGGTDATSDASSDVGPDARRAWRSIQQIQLHGALQNSFARACERYDLPPSAVKALLRLSVSGPTAMREIAAAFACDASYVTTIVDALESRGLASREPHPTDRRVRTVVLTERGHDMSAGIFELLSEPPQAVSVLTADERRQLADLLERVAAADAALGVRGISDR